MTRKKTAGKPQLRLTAGQQQAVAELREVVAAHTGLITLVGEPVLREQGLLVVTVRLATGSFTTAEGGLPLAAQGEDVVIGVPRHFPWMPPQPWVNHTRFAGYAHVLLGRALCIYLDTSREWHPDLGMRGFLDRLWNWFADAAAARFDPATALFHPVGGVPHRTPGTPTIVVRKPLDVQGRAFFRATLTTRTPARLDLDRWATSEAAGDVAQIIVLPEALPYGAGLTLPEVLVHVASTGHVGADQLATLLARTATRNANGTALYLIIASPHHASAGGHHLVAARLPAPAADVLRAVMRKGSSLATINSRAIPASISMEWCHVSDERPEIASRRDASRPVSRFAGTTVEVWGCGGLGSWIAEFIARAGAARIVLRDPGEVQGGLLVRQNYVETDIGGNKADQLAQRLRQICDDLIVESHPAGFPTSHKLPDCDLIVDATINNGAGIYLDRAAHRTRDTTRPMLAMVATDLRTATLGLLTVSASGYPTGPAHIDQAAGPRVLADGTLERFHGLWQEPAEGDEMVPARGCSVPTFHGSAADVAAVAASLVSLLAQHLNTTMSGTHLAAVAHAPGTGPHHHFIPAPEAE
ncbi:ThiF family adenylyltransferase [Micromonospora sp. RL09-050-HVF-A]|uniref:ThiF family adenylyltransferase n=1 Tax=Micromonospora sp. RL09-050-HVF-A TaxID=1703433 RepID=UPI001C5D6BC8|nr:ThiF family adenylyltransferase [Micromonospora sp. RL09-050-HVF-A]MBW4704649.1 ThiF family adenylyltransferase [Micromonospora sp. RL09-050-HVF-A]